ncbi:uncharacterized protein METZ01_LOCUS392096, partial [marine metagenome]
ISSVVRRKRTPLPATYGGEEGHLISLDQHHRISAVVGVDRCRQGAPHPFQVGKPLPEISPEITDITLIRHLYLQLPSSSDLATRGEEENTQLQNQKSWLRISPTASVADTPS